MTDTQDLKRYKYGYSSDEWGMGRSLGLIPDPAGKVCLFADAHDKLEAAQAEIERLKEEEHESQLHLERACRAKDAALARLAEVEGQNLMARQIILEHGSAVAAAGASPVEVKALQDQVVDLTDSRDFYKRRVDLLQQWQSKMRDPERTICCDIIANGQTLPPENAGDRYTAAAGASPAVHVPETDCGNIEAMQPNSCAYCTHPLFVGLKCKNCGRVVQPSQAHGRTNSGDETGGAVERFGWATGSGEPEIIPATNGAFVWYSDYLKLWKSVQPSQAGEQAYISPVRTVADLANNLLMMDQTLPIYGAQYIEHAGKRRCIAVPPTVSRERIKDSRWIGEGDELNAAVIWTRAEQPSQAVELSDLEIATIWISLSDPMALGSKFKSGDQVREFARAIIAAINAKESK